MAELEKEKKKSDLGKEKQDKEENKIRDLPSSLPQDTSSTSV